MKWLALIIAFILAISVNAQQNQKRNNTWYESRYNIISLEELGIEKLQAEKRIFRRKRNTGIFLTAGGYGSAFVAANIASDVNPFKEEEKRIEAADIICFIGLSVFIAGVTTWITNGHRHHQIKKALNTVDVKLGSINYPYEKTNNLYQVGITINF